MSEAVKWSELVSEWSGSGLSQAEFCRRKGLRIHQFQYRREQLRKDDSSSFVELCGDGVSKSIDFVLPSGVRVSVPVDTSASRISELAKCLS